VTTEGLLYTWGAGENGRLGTGDNCDRVVPCLVESLEGIVVESKGIYSYYIAVSILKVILSAFRSCCRICSYLHIV
jgi:alpha-tubulin suppressor-like RCC1 family protein